MSDIAASRESLIASTPQEAQAALPCRRAKIYAVAPLTARRTESKVRWQLTVGSCRWQMADGRWHMAPFLLEHAAAATTSSSQPWRQERYNIKLLENLYPSDGRTGVVSDNQRGAASPRHSITGTLAELSCSGQQKTPTRQSHPSCGMLR